MISTYGWRSDWIRNLAKNPEVCVTCAGLRLRGVAEIVEEPEAKRSIVSAHPFFPAAPFIWVHAILRSLLRPLLVLLLRRWVGPRPIVIIRPDVSPAGT